MLVLIFSCTVINLYNLKYFFTSYSIENQFNFKNCHSVACTLHNFNIVVVFIEKYCKSNSSKILKSSSLQFSLDLIGPWTFIPKYSLRVCLNDYTLYLLYINIQGPVTSLVCLLALLRAFPVGCFTIIACCLLYTSRCV